jgi:hypothetical protein
MKNVEKNRRNADAPQSSDMSIDHAGPNGYGTASPPAAPVESRSGEPSGAGIR